MIVTNVQDGWEIIFQPAHGLLAGSLAEHFAANRQTRHWFATRAAISGHDDQKIAFHQGEHRYVTNVGAPRDFTLVSMTAEQRFIEVRDRLENAYRKHRWIGLLESSHADFLYSDAVTSKPLMRLLSEERERRATILREMTAKESDLEAAYAAMRWCDRCSLILCQNCVPAMGRCLEICELSNTRFDIRCSADDFLTIEPWPFALHEFTVSVEVRTLKQLSFTDDAELGQTLEDCSPELREWMFRKTG